VYANLFMYQEPNLVQIPGKVFCPLANLPFVFCRQFGGTSTSFALINTTKPARFPRIQPMVNSNTINMKNLLQLCCCIGFRAEENTMGTLSHTIMLARFVDSLEYALRFLT